MTSSVNPLSEKTQIISTAFKPFFIQNEKSRQITVGFIRSFPTTGNVRFPCV